MSKRGTFLSGEPRYITRGISDKLPAIYQIILWDTIDALRDTGFELDYMQVFELKTIMNPKRGGKILEVKHSQEIPEYFKSYEIPIGIDQESVEGRIYVIDDITHATMLWAEEY